MADAKDVKDVKEVKVEAKGDQISLFSAAKIGDLELSNRSVMSALTRGRSIVPGDPQVVYYAQRASAGLIISEGTLIEPQGSEWPFAPGIWSAEQVAGWKKVTDAVHAKGSKIFCQLWHIGRVAHPLHQAGQPCVGPSAIAAKGGKFRLLVGAPAYVQPKAIEDPSVYVRMFATAAVNAKKAGFDGVEIHAANGYLPNQFLESHSNKREDKYGGSAANRVRFVLEIADAIIESGWHPSRVGIKLSPGGGYNDMGSPKEEQKETYSLLIEELDKRGLGYVCLVRYNAYLDPVKRGTPFEYTEFSGLLKKSKLMLNSNYMDLKSSEEALNAGAHLVAAGRNWLGNPDLLRRYKEGLELNAPDYSSWNSPKSPDDMLSGYIDYLEYDAAKAAGKLQSKA
jgi:2,4-dienoyl-CoA reductase-like NADH-dependent reductase (Old Yellow Enzyme family)